MHFASEPKRISKLEYRIDPIPNSGMRVPVVIYANQSLIQNMILDRTIESTSSLSISRGP
jgi:tRNA-splicing ligase RtcB